MRWSYPWQPLLLVVTDWCMVVAAEELAYALRQSWLPFANPQFHIPGFYLYLLVPTIFLAFLQSLGAKIRRFPTWKMAQTVFHAVCFSILTITLLMYFGKVGAVVSRLFVAMTGVFAFVFVVGARFLLREFLNRHHLMEIPVLFVGAGETAAELVKTLEAQGGCGMKIIGFIADTPMAARLKGRYRLLGHMEHLERVLHMTGVQHVIVTATGLPAAEQVHIINRIQPYVKNVIFVPDLLGAPVSNMDIDGLLDNSLMLLRFRNNLAHWYNRAGKRVFDLIMCLLGLVLVIPVTIVIAALIRLDSKGPVFFAHQRIGQGGRTFPCYKFRTMVPDAENILKDYLATHPAAREEWERDFKLKCDLRITRIGAFLRRTSLDELPQVWNVIKGDMSLVGPRPIVAEEIPLYGEYFADFCLVPPGITGMWQVNGRSDTTYEERVQMDTWYVRNWSVWIDIAYLLKTVSVVLARKGAY
ncbi:undecaprenyl-phosphate galactose phosphotransferase WbaP [uncultured Selenomonas sp.]|uniref:undecaprenyl-phosphate galactose phosphotransferase WbaP n=1 Tax=uncultured Selenomonas sp. TaxID=159275 RepID=UPI0025D37189|nr:undecaprenyl-phosphate galactose phosphotransferase WbaP [uncultured Selenomonas sp.]